MHRNVLCAIFCVTFSFLLPKSIPTPNQDNLLVSRVRLTSGSAQTTGSTLQEKQGHQLIYTPAAHLLTCNKIKMLASPPKQHSYVAASLLTLAL